MAWLRYPDAPCAVYRCYDVGGELLYVGSSGDLKDRFRQHRHGSWWLPYMNWVTFRWYGTRETAQKMEYKAIRLERPLFNKSGSDDLSCPLFPARGWAYLRERGHAVGTANARQLPREGAAVDHRV